MKKGFKKFLAAGLAMLTCVCSMNTSVFAAENVWNGADFTREITAGTEGYTYISIYPGTAYEMSNHMVTANNGEHNDIPQTLVLTDASKDYTFSFSGPYVYGESNYDVMYCCDAETGYEDNVYYKRVNLEDSSYYNEADAQHIRAIVTNSYPYVSIDEMKAFLTSTGFIGAEDLTRADIISGVQAAIWSYSNDVTTLKYSQTFDIPTNTQWGKVFHDYTNEMNVWWQTGKRKFSKDETVGARINALSNHLRSLDPEACTPDEIIINDMQMLRAEPISLGEDLYSVSLRILLNEANDNNDNITLTVSSKSENGVTETLTYDVTEENKYEITIQAKYGDTITAVLEGTQILPKGVYLYEPKAVESDVPEGDRTVSQTLVGVGEGKTDVYEKKSFLFDRDIESGVRFYKSNSVTGGPISDITFSVYKVDDADLVNPVPTDEEVLKYKTAENLVESKKTDVFGYAAFELDKGTYLVIEEHNTEKVVAPVDPFYVHLPMYDAETNETLDIVPIYPKNTPVPPNDPPQEELKGSFNILKHSFGNEEKVLKGAKFQVLRPATSADDASAITTVTCNEKTYNVVPVIYNDSELVLTTGEDGTASSPDLDYGFYFIKETKAPLGYSKNEDAVLVTVSATSSTETIKIANKPIIELPETGGIGTAMFTSIGSIMILLAIGILFFRKKYEA